MPTIPGIGMGPINYGYDFNFFDKITITNSTFNSTADIFIPFSTYTVTFQLESGGPVQYSFNGATVHGDMTLPVTSTGVPSSFNLKFENRVIGKIWFLASTTAVVRVEAWSIR